MVKGKVCSVTEVGNVVYTTELEMDSVCRHTFPPQMFLPVCHNEDSKREMSQMSAAALSQEEEVKMLFAVHRERDYQNMECKSILSLPLFPPAPLP